MIGKVDWTKVWDCYQGLPEPLFTIPIHGEEMWVIQWPEEYLSDGLRGQNIRIYIPLGFWLRPGTMKTIAAADMFDRALETGILERGGELSESTSGGLGIALAYHATARRPGSRIKVTLIVSDALPPGKLLPLVHFGANVLKESQVMKLLELKASPGAIALAQMYAEQFGAVHLNQYGGNPATHDWNPDSYGRHLARPLWEGLGGHAGMFITPVGSRGIFLGLGRAFREWNPNIKLFGVVPYYRQNIDGTRTLTRQKDVKHDLEALKPYSLERIDESAVEKYIQKLTGFGIPAGRSSGGGYGSAEHLLLNMVEDGEIDSIRSPDGVARVVLPFHDSRFPYDIG